MATYVATQDRLVAYSIGETLCWLSVSKAMGRRSGALCGCICQSICRCTPSVQYVGALCGTKVYGTEGRHGGRLYKSGIAPTISESKANRWLQACGNATECDILVVRSDGCPVYTRTAQPTRPSMQFITDPHPNRTAVCSSPRPSTSLPGIKPLRPRYLNDFLGAGRHSGMTCLCLPGFHLVMTSHQIATCRHARSQHPVPAFAPFVA